MKLFEKELPDGRQFIIMDDKHFGMKELNDGNVYLVAHGPLGSRIKRIIPTWVSHESFKRLRSRSEEVSAESVARENVTVREELNQRLFTVEINGHRFDYVDLLVEYASDIMEKLGCT